MTSLDTSSGENAQDAQRRFSNAVTALIYYFITPSQEIRVRSVVDESLLLDAIDELCPDVVNRVADLYLRLVAAVESHPQLMREVLPPGQRTFRLPLLAFLLQRFVYTTTNTWIPGYNFDAWYCWRRLRSRKVQTALSPFFVQCEMLVFTVSPPGDLDNLIFPFNSRGAKATAVDILEREMESPLCLGVHAPPAITKHFLWDSWSRTFENLCASLHGVSFSVANAFSILKDGIGSAKYLIQSLPGGDRDSLGPNIGSDDDATLWSAHRNVVFLASPFDLVGTCVFLAVKNTCESRWSDQVLSSTEEDLSAACLARFHTDCLHYYNYTTCKLNRIEELLDSVTYFTESSCRRGAPRSPSHEASRPEEKLNPCQLSKEQKQKNVQRSTVQFLPFIHEKGSPAQFSRRINFKCCFSQCLRDKALLSMYQSVHSNHFSGDCKSDDNELFANGTREDFDRLIIPADEITLSIHRDDDGDVVQDFLRTPAEMKAYEAVRAELYPEELPAE